MSQTTWLALIYQQYRQELFLTARAVLRQADLSEDAVHAAFVRLARRATMPREPKLYVFRAVRNAALDLAKTRSRRREEALPADWDLSRPEAESGTPDPEVLRAVSEGLERLESASREVIELHLHAGLTFQEIGLVLEEPLPTVAARYRRALEKLGQEIKVRHA